MKINWAYGKRVFKGWLKSWTSHTGTLVIMLGLVQQNLPAFSLSAEENALVLIGVGTAIHLLRFKTTTSLAEK